MLSFTNAPIHFFLLPNSFTDMIPHMFPCAPFDGNSRRRKKDRLLSLHFVAVRESCSFDVKNRSYRDFYWSCSGFVRRCKKGWETEGNFALEEDILEFMKYSENPQSFPSKKQLIDAGRMDLVEAILEQGGWLASGWDLDDNVNQEVGAHYNGDIDFSLMRDGEWKNAVTEQRADESDEERSHEPSFSHFGSYPAASSSGRSLETSVEDSGIEGILSRLEKERDKEISHVQNNDLRRDWLTKSSKNGTVVDLERNNEPNNGKISDKFSHGRSPSNIDGFSHSLKPDAWRIWSAERAGFSEIKVEADEIFSKGPIIRGEKHAFGDEILKRKGEYSVSLNRRKDTSSPERIKSNQIQSRLQHLESELSSILDVLKSKADENVQKKVHESSSDELLMLSDAWEFQENDMLNARHKLRSIRAKLAVLEGKMALAIIDAQKIMEEKQKRIDNARRALQLLRTACIVWPNSASEVLLAGSFDGWSTKRKMQKSSTGIFSLCMKLYPGRYEIKFIVDGEWRIDPLRPVVRNNGYENNLLIIT
ncbi:protein PTST homolog 2, chloroplastic [Euphorbia lathyris]|uniref:protein PTST homolog 2, chloroplastic n=1 Tax=Euphorbia lathyris TaxID=212925 RepID=UPI003313E0FB